MNVLYLDSDVVKHCALHEEQRTMDCSRSKTYKLSQLRLTFGSFIVSY